MLVGVREPLHADGNYIPFNSWVLQFLYTVFSGELKHVDCRLFSTVNDDPIGNKLIK